jgi:oxygen-independent coproporphyrinogen-3 oxidase
MSGAKSKFAARSHFEARPSAAYVHVPFCAHRCGYCNFTLLAGRDELIDRYLGALELELSATGGPHPVDTLFFGGGTPTHLPLGALDRLFDLVQQTFPLAPGGELSVEANPIDVRPELARLLADRGVTRLSLGAQSFDPAKLALLERDHAADDIRRAFTWAAERLPAVALDLIFGCPGENSQIWAADLAAAIALGPAHLSTYGLTFERGTAFWTRRAKGALVPLDEEQERELYALAIDSLTAAGFEHYEVSNFARPGGRCRHNENYWAGGSYFAAGPGAARHLDGRREMNHRSTTTYIKRVFAGQSPVAEREQLSAEDRARETLVFGLRRMAGVERQAFAQATGFSLDALGAAELARFVAAGLLADDGDRVRLTREGLFVSDGIWPHFLRA